MRIAIEREYCSILTQEFDAKIVRHNSQWEDAMEQERHTAVTNAKAFFSAEMSDQEE